MLDRELLQEALRHVDQAAFALSGDVTASEVAVARAQLDEIRALLSRAAFQQATLPPGTLALPADDQGEADDGPSLVRRVRLEGDLRAAGAARSFVGLTCAQWGLPAAATSTVVDLASELVANAARHAGGSIGLALERRGPDVVVTVSDRSSEPPRLLPYRRGVSEQGIGLRLVDQLCESWGWNTAPEGKHVWARAAVEEGSVRPSSARRVPALRRRAADTR